MSTILLVNAVTHLLQLFAVIGRVIDSLYVGCFIGCGRVHGGEHDKAVHGFPTGRAEE